MTEKHCVELRVIGGQWDGLRITAPEGRYFVDGFIFQFDNDLYLTDTKAGTLSIVRDLDDLPDLHN